MRSQLAVIASAAFLAVNVFAVRTARAEIVSYTIDPAQSTLTLTGDLTGSLALPQTTGSLTTSYAGTIVADRNGSMILFPGGSLLDAALQSSGQQPRNDGTPGTQAADYGRRTPDGGGPFGSTTYEAIRNLQLDLFDDTFGVGATLAGDGTFASTSFGLEIDSGESDAIYGLGLNADNSLVGKGTANSNGNGLSSLVVDGLIETLTLKFSTGAIGYNVNTTADSTMSFTGTIVATREVPEPAGAIGALAALTAISVARRRRR